MSTLARPIARRLTDVEPSFFAQITAISGTTTPTACPSGATCTSWLTSGEVEVTRAGIARVLAAAGGGSSSGTGGGFFDDLIYLPKGRSVVTVGAADSPTSLGSLLIVPAGGNYGYPNRPTPLSGVQAYPLSSAGHGNGGGEGAASDIFETYLAWFVGGGGGSPWAYYGGPYFNGGGGGRGGGGGGGNSNGYNSTNGSPGSANTGGGGGPGAAGGTGILIIKTWP